MIEGIRSSTQQLKKTDFYVLGEEMQGYLGAVENFEGVFEFFCPKECSRQTERRMSSSLFKRNMLSTCWVKVPFFDNFTLRPRDFDAFFLA